MEVDETTVSRIKLNFIVTQEHLETICGFWTRFFNSVIKTAGEEKIEPKTGEATRLFTRTSRNLLTFRWKFTKASG